MNTQQVQPGEAGIVCASVPAAPPERCPYDFPSCVCSVQAGKLAHISMAPHVLRGECDPDVYRRVNPRCAVQVPVRKAYTSHAH